jgi:hypothetical protein
VPESTFPSPPPNPEAPAKGKFALDELGLFGTALAAIGGGLGILGFVAFFGAAILWVRMDEAGLPGNEALAIIPKSVMVSTGASFLVPALLLALGATVVLYLIDAFALWWSEKPIRKLKGELREARRRTRRFDEQGELCQQVVEIVDRKSAPIEDATLRGVVDQTVNTSVLARQAEEEAIVLEGKLVGENVPQRREESERKRARILAALTIVLFAGGTLLALLQYSVELWSVTSLLLAIATVALITFCVVVRVRTGNFGWFAAAAIVAVGTMSGLITYYRTVEDVKIEPAAVLRSNGPPLAGFYVAQTSDRLYLGTKSGEEAVLQEIPRAAVVEFAVGDLQDPDEADEQALELVVDLCRRSQQRKADGTVTGDKGGGKLGEEIAHGCTAEDLDLMK